MDLEAGLIAIGRQDLRRVPMAIGVAGAREGLGGAWATSAPG